MTRKELEDAVEHFLDNLKQEERKEITIKKYRNDIFKFLEFSAGEPMITKEIVIRYKNSLLNKYQPSSVNSYLISLNQFLRWLNHQELTVRTEKLQRRCSLNHVLTKSEYEKLLDYAQKNKKNKYFYLMKTLAGTGIRVGELKYITCENVKNRMAVIRHKGKIREICIPDSLCRLLWEYCEKQGITHGLIFHGNSPDQPLDVSGIWKSLKRLARAAGVDETCVYPHSFRHLFAKTYMCQIGNLTELSDILGHSNLETTRIYTMETMEEKLASLSRLNL